MTLVAERALATFLEIDAAIAGTILVARYDGGFAVATEDTRITPLADDAQFLTLNADVTSIGGGAGQIPRNIIGERLLGPRKEPEIDRTISFRDVRAG